MPEPRRSWLLATSGRLDAQQIPDQRCTPGEIDEQEYQGRTNVLRGD